MVFFPNVLWLSVSPYLKCLDQRLLCQLVKAAPVRRWEYCQTLDEPCCIDTVIDTLHSYIREAARPHELANPGIRRNRQGQQPDHPQGSPKFHLLGHGVSGVIALLYARRYPENLASVTLLSVDATPAINWQAHYYRMRELVPCPRAMVLTQMAQMLFGQQSAKFSMALAKLLERDLDSNLTLHSLAHHANIPAGSSQVPLLVCNGAKDSVLSGQNESLWQQCLKPSDRHWLCPDGRHFFHFHNYHATARVITDHWQQASLTAAIHHPTAHNPTARS